MLPTNTYRDRKYFLNTPFESFEFKTLKHLIPWGHTKHLLLSLNWKHFEKIYCWRCILKIVSQKKYVSQMSVMPSNWHTSRLESPYFQCSNRPSGNLYPHWQLTMMNILYRNVPKTLLDLLEVVPLWQILVGQKLNRKISNPIQIGPN